MNKSISILSVLLLLLNGCAEKKEEMTHKYTNALIEETSPYLIQHAHNPVNWEAWHPEVLERAQKENKLLLISIGYAACHWCHVMEEECFEDEEVAKVMNESFINIKIDREERPDVDQIYMDAIQMMTGNGGWPLNILALPDGRPFWGATYLPKDNWVKSLNQLTRLYTEDPNKIIAYAADLERGIQSINLVENKEDANNFSLDQLREAVEKWSTYFDTFLGGYKRAPKFMMPNNLDFLLHYATSQDDKRVLEYINTTLTRMAYGGIYDQVGGGFSRYSVDTKWHVPHFEKMLYDNGQLISLYAKAYAITKNPLYKKVVEETIAFVQEELSDENGGYYSSLDADSLNESGELEEGAFYVWTREELEQLLGSDFEIFKDYYNINSYGEWEENYVLIRDKSDKEISEKHHISIAVLNEKLNESLEILKEERNNRPKPRLDDKILTSWNGLMLKGLTDAYRYLQDDNYLKLALKNASFIEKEMMKNSGALFRNHKNDKSNINGFLEDYASTIEGFIALYEVTFDLKWLDHSKKLTDYALKHFNDEASGMLFFTSDEDDTLIRRTLETNDNVVSASNSIIANNLLKLHKVFSKEGYGARAHQMLKNIQDNFVENGQSYANWMHLVLYENLNFYEIAVVGDDYKKLGKTILSNYIPNSVIVGSEKEGNIELLKSRYNEGETLVYVCIEGTCKLPVNSAEEALNQL
ncbi:thioredoxin domain-containing protein [Croceitalea rosinachiae]|uniref:Thioredoxin domain-containing protein n=1 Tax=Croceitalea rosinachiae TaxID=3075596 RepID=A0ABU3A737_9FLAO|nr:thioredoxin domain-containing protein [Croceitalea sp. F388]MDT0605645.1 thioredoxin domain-containing protein [Croceitalea sp. F388]